ncbi:uncharacterized protein EAF02_004982 [Botrytis sinoallii]|uniref:uncharacterized protein n=1 Tax=Botrytis sinoallii TaxID=1463999 RepID=UPI001900CE86|nr:uncharacterized protein EAF02_004982 [Botrytis sinoallii]KAF7884646.1 hypothetical protein EAF02_004982 [Botrytis sinoallii]
MYSAVTNGLGGGGIEAPFHPTTINPQALNQGALNPVQAISPNEIPRGVKRSRSPDTYNEIPQVDNHIDDARKRGRPMKLKSAVNTSENSKQSQMPHSTSTSSQSGQPQTPQSQHAVLPHNRTPGSNLAQTPVPKQTPKPVIKALPTVRDHTTDQLGAEGDEYIPREYDEQGEKKVSAMGHLTDGREYRCRTFYVPNRGDKLFMLATESLYKIIATQAEKEDLIHQEILPFSYRSRQIAIVTAKSMFRQFGSRVIVNGRRVRDDYWETKARKQGFTEDDLAGEKRPGAAKARDAAAAAEASAALAASHHHGDIYSNGPGHYGYPQAAVPSAMMGIPSATNPLPMITTLAPEQTDMRLRDYSSIQRPRQELAGTAYQDRTQPSSHADLSNHVNQAAEYSKQINQQRSRSHDYLERRWRQPHEVSGGNIVQATGNHDGLPSAQTLRSPRASQSIAQQPILAHQNPQNLSYSQASHQPGIVSQPPIRSAPSRQEQAAGRSPSIPIASASNMNQGTNSYQFTSQNQMWPSSQPQQQSPQQHAFNPSYPSHPSQQSPHIQQSPHQPPPPPLRQSGSNPQMQPALQYSGMQGMGQNYAAPNRNIYQPESSNHQFMQPTTSGPQPSSQGWAPQQPTGTSAGWVWTGQRNRWRYKTILHSQR